MPLRPPVSHGARRWQGVIISRELVAFCALGLPVPAAALESVLAIDNPAQVSSGGPGLSAAAHYFVGNDPLSARAYFNDWQGNYHPRDGLNLGLASLRSEAGVQWAGWRVSEVRRLELLIESGREMTDLERFYKTRQALPAGQAYAIDIRYAAYEAKGWRLDKAWNWKLQGGQELGLGVGYSLLEGTRVRAGSALGSVTSQGRGNYTYSARMDDASSRKTYPFQTPGTPQGSGGTADVGLYWKTPGGARLEYVVNDLFGRMRWSEIPGTVTNANTGVTGTDPNGFIVYAPALSGRNARRDFTQKLTMRWGMEAEIPWRDFYVLGSLSHLQQTSFPLLAAGWKPLRGWRVQADYDFRFKTYGLKATGHGVFVALRASQRDLGEASAYGFSAGVTWAF